MRKLMIFPILFFICLAPLLQADDEDSGFGIGSRSHWLIGKEGPAEGAALDIMATVCLGLEPKERPAISVIFPQFKGR